MEVVLLGGCDSQSSEAEERLRENRAARGAYFGGYIRNDELRTEELGLLEEVTAADQE